jgi:ABC-type transporter Mla MlaB component
MAEPQVLNLSGAMHLRAITDPHAALVQALGAGSDVILDLSEVEEADLTFIQLILSATRTASERGLSLTLSAPAPEPVMQLLERGGFVGAAPDPRRDFWLAQ